jgi:hypothetical protein
VLWRTDQRTSAQLHSRGTVWARSSMKQENEHLLEIAHIGPTNWKGSRAFRRSKAQVRNDTTKVDIVVDALLEIVDIWNCSSWKEG